MVQVAYGLVRAGANPPLDASSTMLELVRLRRCLTRLNINCVLDVGANTGQFATRLRRLGYRGWIHSFEPNHEAFRVLEEIHRNDPLWRGYPIALGSARETRPFYVHPNSSLSSFLLPTQGSSNVAATTVAVQRLDDIVDIIVSGLPDPKILLKLDTQGWDLEVVRGAETTLRCVLALLSEVSVQPLYERMTPYHEALEFYGDLGFVLYDMTVINRAPDDTVVECDCLLIRRPALNR
jgi:FkbM family methyltransferase